MSYVFIAISIISFGISNCLWVFPLRNLSVWQVIAWRSLFSSLFIFFLLSIIISFSIEPLKEVFQMKSFSVDDYLQAVVICAYSYFGLVFYNFSLKYKTPVCVAVPITSICSFFGIITAVLLYGDKFNLYEGLAAILFFIAVIVIESKANGFVTFKLSKGVLFAIASALVWGTSFAFFPISIRKLGGGMFALVLESTVFLSSIIIISVLTRRFNSLLEPAKYLNKILPISLCGFLGTLFYSLSAQSLKMSTIFVLDTITPTVSILVGVLVLKEKLALRQYFAIALIFFGLIIMRNI